MSKRIHVIINPAAGQDRPILGTLNRAFKDADVDWDVFVTKKAGDAERFARQALEAGVDAVGVYGGDGSVMAVASALAGTELPLAIFPGGTANVMSIELGIPSDLAEACALVCGQQSAIRLVDMGRVEVLSGEGGQATQTQRWFMLRVGVGFEAKMVEGADRELKSRIGVLAYGVAAIQALVDPPFSRYLVTVDGAEFETEGITCMVANAGSMGRTGLFLAPSIDVSDGMLDLVVIRSADLPSLLSVAASMATGREDAQPLLHWQGREITIVSETAQNVQVDGELLGRTPVRTQVEPAAVRVIVPAA